MTDEELQQLVERDNLARVTAMSIEHLAQVAAKQRQAHPHPEVAAAVGDAIRRAEDMRLRRIEQLQPDIRARIALHDQLAADHGADPLPIDAPPVEGEPEGLPEDLLAAYRGLRQRMAEVEHITLSPTAIRCGAEVPET